MLFLINDLDTDFVKKQTENQYMITNKIMDDDGYYLNKDKKRVDSEGRRINDRFEYVIEYEGKEIRGDEFGNPINEDGSIDVKMDKKINPDDYPDEKKDTKKAVEKEEAPVKEQEEEPFK